MTPTTLTKPAGITVPCTAACTDNPTGLAGLPLQFTPERICRNKGVKAAVIDALADKSQSDQCIAAIFKNAWLHRYQSELNQLIRNIENQHGPGTVLVNQAVVRLLADEGLYLQQNSNGTVQLEKMSAIESDPLRHDLIASTLDGRLTQDLCKLIAAFDEEIQICEKNRDEIIAILESGDISAKGLLFAAASHQRQIPFLNRLFNALSAKGKLLSLVGIDLRNLDLTGIDLSHANLGFANLQNCCLANAQLSGAWLMYANLNQANLSKADLARARLHNARLIAANLFQANLNDAFLDYACLLCANLDTIRSGTASALMGTIFNFSTFSSVPDYHIEWICKAQEPLNVLILPQRPDPCATLTNDSMPYSLASPVNLSMRAITVVIDEHEKLLLLKKGILMRENRNGTVQLSQPLAMRTDLHRKRGIDTILPPALPKVLKDLIRDYDDDIEIGEKNEHAIINFLKSGTQSDKGMIIAAASRQFQIPYLNKLLLKIRQQGSRLNFSCVDLSNLNLQGINLNYVNLSHAIMHDCNLYQATLHHANLLKVNLNGAFLQHAEFSNANMAGARLFGANLKNSILINVILVDAVLKFANLENADLQGSTEMANACLDHAVLTNANLTQADMANVSLIHADLSGVNLHEADLSNAKMMHANLRWASMVGVNLTNADLSHANVEQVVLMAGPVLTGTVWKGVRARKIFTDAATRKMLPFLIRLRCC